LTSAVGAWLGRDESHPRQPIRPVVKSVLAMACIPGPGDGLIGEADRFLLPTPLS
jgi:hypothetical protein